MSVSRLRREVSQVHLPQIAPVRVRPSVYQQSAEFEGLATKLNRKEICAPIDLSSASSLPVSLTYVDLSVVSEGVSVRRRLRRAPPQR